VSLDRDASVRFLVPITVRVIRVHDWSTDGGWSALDHDQRGPRPRVVTPAPPIATHREAGGHTVPKRVSPLPRRTPRTPVELAGAEPRPRHVGRAKMLVGGGRWSDDRVTLERLVIGLRRLGS
jgi:hypothetical protein